MGERYPPIEPYDHGHLPVGDGHEMYWETVGNPSGTPALWLHGGPGSGSTPGIRRWFDSFYEVMDQIRWDAHAFHDAGDQVVVGVPELGQAAQVLGLIRARLLQEVFESRAVGPTGGPYSSRTMSRKLIQPLWIKA